jgi:hypothetical protein
MPCSTLPIAEEWELLTFESYSCVGNRWVGFDRVWWFEVGLEGRLSSGDWMGAARDKPLLVLGGRRWDGLDCGRGCGGLGWWVGQGGQRGSRFVVVVVVASGSPVE